MIWEPKFTSDADLNAEPTYNASGNFVDAMPIDGEPTAAQQRDIAECKAAMARLRGNIPLKKCYSRTRDKEPLKRISHLFRAPSLPGKIPSRTDDSIWDVP